MKSFFGRRRSSEAVDDGLPRWVRCLVVSPVLGLMMASSVMAAEPDGGMLNPSITDAELMAELLENPQSLPLNFALLQRQMDAGQFEPTRPQCKYQQYGTSKFQRCAVDGRTIDAGYATRPLDPATASGQFYAPQPAR